MNREKSSDKESAMVGFNYQPEGKNACNATTKPGGGPDGQFFAQSTLFPPPIIN